MVQMPPPTSRPRQIQKADDKQDDITENDLEVGVDATPKPAKSKEIEKMVAAERTRNLALLSGLFGDEDVWEGREDGCGVEVEASESGEYDESGDIALCPTRQGQETIPAESSVPVNVAGGIPPPSPPLVSPSDSPEEPAISPERQTAVKRLKDLFAPAVEPGT